jgi:hypothetical protein
MAVPFTKTKQYPEFDENFYPCFSNWSSSMSSAPLLKMNKACGDSVLWAIRTLEEAGYRAMQTFDLQASRLAHFDCPCPHHGTEKCDCQMVVLLVYQGQRSPITMIIHGSDHTSWFYLVNTPQQPVEHRLEITISRILNPQTDQSVAPVILSEESTPQEER